MLDNFIEDKVVSLYSLADWQNGLAFKDITFSSSGVPVIKIAELKNGITDQTKFTLDEFDSSVKLHKGDMLFSWSGNPETSIDIFYYKYDTGWLNQHIFKVIPKNIDKRYLYYLLKSMKTEFQRIASNKQTTGLGHVTIADLKRLQVYIPKYKQQQHIVNILGTIDDKIENNEKIIKLLKQLFTLKCNDFFDNLTEYNCKNLDEIAIFTNGLPMQKFRPQGNNFLPVLKIKELNQGTCDTNSEHCDTQIPDIYIVNNGDVIFSWSGTLLVDLWKGEKCGLNQHLYKVTSSNYPKWFYYYWINKYLPKFINIAQGKATTMGHIKRSDITNSIVKIPNSLNDISFVSKYIEKIIKINKINNKLKKLKNIYLAKFFQ